MLFFSNYYECVSMSFLREQFLYQKLCYIRNFCRYSQTIEEIFDSCVDILVIQVKQMMYFSIQN